MKKIFVIVLALTGGTVRAQMEDPVAPPSCPDSVRVVGYGSEYGGSACGNGDVGDYSVEKSDDSYEGSASGYAQNAKFAAFKMAQEKCAKVNPMYYPKPLGEFEIKEVCSISGYGREQPVIRVFRNYLCQYQW
jgi:hypothetical protein